MQAKFQYFAFWPRIKITNMVNQIYRFAEVKGVDSDSFPYEPRKQRASSCMMNPRIMTLSNLNSGALTPRQMELARYLDGNGRIISLSKKRPSR